MTALLVTGEITNSTDNITSGKTRVAVTTTGDLEDSGVKSVTTGEVTIVHGLTTPGLMLMWNTDTTNFVKWGMVTATYPFKLPANSVPSIVYLDSAETTIFLAADTATCEVRFLIYQV
jgi:hypothetical protein